MYANMAQDQMFGKGPALDTNRAQGISPGVQAILQAMQARGGGTDRQGAPMGRGPMPGMPRAPGPMSVGQEVMGAPMVAGAKPPMPELGQQLYRQKPIASTEDSMRAARAPDLGSLTPDMRRRLAVFMNNRVG